MLMHFQSKESKIQQRLSSLALLRDLYICSLMDHLTIQLTFLMSDRKVIYCLLRQIWYTDNVMQLYGTPHTVDLTDKA